MQFSRYHPAEERAKLVKAAHDNYEAALRTAYRTTQTYSKRLDRMTQGKRFSSSPFEVAFHPAALREV